jgi:drug/metabolite transporter (DMT)-like permease
MSNFSPDASIHRQRRAKVEVILAAIAFAASIPANKSLLAGVSPLSLSATVYLSAGILCAMLVVHSRRQGDVHGAINAVRGREWAWLAGAVLAGGVLAPLLLFVGLKEVSGHVAGLLLNFEAVFTVGLGVVLSGEHFGRRGWIGAFAIIVGAVLLSLAGERAPSTPTRWTGIVLVIGACALWGLDNNLTQKVSLRDARQIVAVKGLAGGITSLALAAAFGGFGQWNALRLLTAVAVGVISFGASIVLFVRGLRQLGVLQTGMLFALAPGFAAVLSWALLREPIATAGVLALVAMTVGALLLATDRHEHWHVHEPLEHTHEHEHDEHHQHEHTPEQLAQTPHAHPHRHEALTHAHGHMHDVHHRHRH